MSLTDDIFAKRGTWQLFKSVGEYDLSTANIGHIDHHGRLWLRLAEVLLCTDGRHVIRCCNDAVLAHRTGGKDGFTGDGRYWMISNDNRLLSVSLDSGVITDHTDKVPPLDNAYWLRASSHETILLALPDTALQYGDETVCEVPFPEKELGKIHSGVITSDGKIWLTSFSGLYNVDNGRVLKRELPMISEGNVHDVIAGYDGEVWVPAKGMVYRVKEDACELVAKDKMDPLQTYTGLNVDNQNNFWLGLHFRGAMCVSQEGSVLIPFEDTPALSWPRCIVQDKTNAFWFIGVGNGILRYDPHTLDLIQHGFLEAYSMGSDGKLALAAASRGLLEYDTERGEIKQLCADLPSRCFWMIRSPSGEVYIASQQGLYVYDAKKERLLRSNDIPELQDLPVESVHYVAWDGEECLWISTTDCLYRLEESGLKCYRKSELGLNGRVFLFLDSSNVLWFLSSPDSPILRFDDTGFSTFPGKLGHWFGPDNVRVTCCTEDNEGNLWIGSSHGNIARCDVEGGVVELAMELTTSVHNIRFDKSGVKWISTVGCLVVSDGDTLYRWTEEALLPSRRMLSTIELDNGKIFIMTERGLCEYRPNRNDRPEVFISKVIGDKVYDSPKSPLKFKSRSVVSIYITAVNMKAGPLCYRARLTGRDTDWIETGKEEFHYEWLPEGDYRFEVTAFDQDLSVSMETATVDIQVVADSSDVQIAELESELHHAEDFSANIFRSINDAIIVLDSSGIVSSANQAALELLGYDEATLLGNPASIVFPAEHKSLFDTQGLLMLNKRGYFQAREVEMRDADSNRLPVLLSASCMYDRTEKFQGYVLAASDISEFKTLQAQVLHSQKMESLGMLAGGVAHDFNNLLSIILGNADLVRSDMERDSEEFKCMSDIIKAGDQASKLCSELLAYAGKRKKVQSPFDLTAIVEENSDLLRSSVNRKISIETELDESLPKVLGDEVQVMQIVLNLVINAAEAIGDNVGTISLTTKIKNMWTDTQRGKGKGELSEPGKYVLLEVSDTGCGMDEETRAKVFEPFFTTKPTGRGLGLSAIHGIVKSHGGKIEVDSKLGQGTTFSIYLPAFTGNLADR